MQASCGRSVPAPGPRPLPSQRGGCLSPRTAWSGDLGGSYSARDPEGRGIRRPRACGQDGGRGAMRSPKLPGLVLSLLLLLPPPGPVGGAARFDPTWESLDARQLPAWFDQAKFGIFIHWGVFSVPSFGSEWFWWYWQKEKLPSYVDFMKNNYPPDFTYADFGPLFTAKFFDANQWADILQASGAKYVVLTSKHHEGFTLWGSERSWNWNAVDEGPKRDIVKELAVAVRTRTDLRFGLYYSLFEWFHPLFLEDESSSFQKQQYPLSKMLPELYELVNQYQPEVLWSDGDGGAPDTYWNSTVFLAWLYNESPVRDTVVTNDRWGAGSICKHGGYYTCSDRYNPGHLLPHKWENCMTIDQFSWGYRRNAGISDYLTIEELVKQLVETVSCGGNLLMNIGPTKDGTISAIFEERLRQMGTWLKVNGEAIYDTHAWRSQNDTVTPEVWYTSKPKNKLVYAMFLKWPTSGQLFLGQPKATLGATEVELLGHGQPLQWTPLEQNGIMVELPQLTVHQMPCKWGWALALTNVT
ncbi:plasma alpha-L-fucosidase isoform X2 [Sagmatias obliquidens]|uniref:plasma alpha-L-fucosidase isoform X2 n=1 Tax=Sagmatias obliquidens TaxID=3371155 RepID=UPI000F44041E|nr:plasma alpha-L-fucosidase isoform X2 [Lagenorhynchus obliquidens]